MSEDLPADSSCASLRVAGCAAEPGVDRISLVSMPGGGKSTVGRYLARRLDWTFIDLDLLIERQVGMPIRAFFESEGEERFRDIEQIAVAEAVAERRSVLATGGGVVLRQANRELLRCSTTAVYLHSTPEDLMRRLRHDVKRPLLQVADPLSKLRELYALRDPLYREVAHFVIETGRPSVPTLVNMILMQLELAGAIDPSHASSPIGAPPD